MLKPLFTEKSLKMAKLGKYTFVVPGNLSKMQIKSLVARIFNVHVEDVKTTTTPGESRRNVKGVKFLTKKVKKAIVTLKDKEKIDLFEEGQK